MNNLFYNPDLFDDKLRAGLAAGRAGGPLPPAALSCIRGARDPAHPRGATVLDDIPARRISG
jgi:hypothetical protein